MMPSIDLALDGPTEQEWDVACASLPPFAWPNCGRLVVVSPHPDDETLGVGGLIATAVGRGVPVLVIAVTDGEAASSRPGLAEVRAAELATALSMLGGEDAIEHRRLRLRDGGLRQSAQALGGMLDEHIGANDLVTCPLPDDGHPDHRAVSIAATRSAIRCGAAVCWFAVWAWHCHDPQRSRLKGGQRLVLSTDARARKRRAIGCYVSQLEGDEPVVPPWMLVRLDRAYEVLVAGR